MRKYQIDGLNYIEKIGFIWFPLKYEGKWLWLRSYRTTYLVCIGGKLCPIKKELI